ncbi:hypothetical protein HPG69_018718 [Diceros bicornis minor]|uniref:Uncharacterized protein n=1 Tax=Diceros bicornis minor TaxID=77932 RepID=A0A7J7EDZ7_DICBM|nr:hypothetical protein HPG69_018718 [Diceros bicornis minor]
MALVDELVAEHKMAGDMAQPPRDLTDSFLDEVGKVSCQGQGQGWRLRDPRGEPGHGGASVSLSDQEPGLMGRVQQETDEVRGQAQQPEMGNQTHMPLTMAMVHEVQRFGDIIPLGLPHMTLKCRASSSPREGREGMCQINTQPRSSGASALPGKPMAVQE